jgi:hypothetical protein
LPLETSGAAEPPPLAPVALPEFARAGARGGADSAGGGLAGGGLGDGGLGDGGLGDADLPSPDGDDVDAAAAGVPADGAASV